MIVAIPPVSPYLYIQVGRKERVLLFLCDEISVIPALLKHCACVL